MVRVPLEELVLQIHLLRLGPAAQFLERVLEPPPAKSVAAAVSQLQAVGALSPEENLTPLGAHPSSCPAHSARSCCVHVCVLGGGGGGSACGLWCRGGSPAM